MDKERGGGEEGEKGFARKKDRRGRGKQVEEREGVVKRRPRASEGPWQGGVDSETMDEGSFRVSIRNDATQRISTGIERTMMMI